MISSGCFNLSKLVQFGFHLQLFMSKTASGLFGHLRGVFGSTTPHLPALFTGVSRSLTLTLHRDHVTTLRDSISGCLSHTHARAGIAAFIFYQPSPMATIFHLFHLCTFGLVTTLILFNLCTFGLVTTRNRDVNLLSFCLEQ